MHADLLSQLQSLHINILCADTLLFKNSTKADGIFLESSDEEFMQDIGTDASNAFTA
jgi:hypothetical protein